MSWQRATFGRTTELALEVTDARLRYRPTRSWSATTTTQFGFISVWVEGGSLASIEYSWFTDVMPTEFPPVDRLRLLDWQV